MNHFENIIGGIHKLIVNAVITNKDSGERIKVPLHVDGGCEVAELVLLEEDILALNLRCEPSLSNARQSDGSVVVIAEYDKVLVELQTDTGEVWGASLNASTVRAPPLATNSESASPIIGVSGVDDTSRLLGYGGISRLGVRQDFRQHKLVKVLVLSAKNDLHGKYDRI